MTSSAHCQSQSNFHAHFHLAVNGNFQLKLFRLNNLAEWGERERTGKFANICISLSQTPNSMLREELERDSSSGVLWAKFPPN